MLWKPQQRRATSPKSCLNNPKTCLSHVPFHLALLYSYKQSQQLDLFFASPLSLLTKIVRQHFIFLFSSWQDWSALLSLLLICYVSNLWFISILCFVFHFLNLSSRFKIWHKMLAGTEAEVELRVWSNLVALFKQ